MLRARNCAGGDIEITASDAFGDDIFLVQGTGAPSKATTAGWS